MNFTVIFKRGQDTIQFKMEAEDIKSAFLKAEAQKKEIFPNDEVSINIIEFQLPKLGEREFPFPPPPPFDRR